MKPDHGGTKPETSDTRALTVATITFLSGSNRGKIQGLSARIVHINEHKDHVAIVESADDSTVSDHIATFHRAGNSY